MHLQAKIHHAAGYLNEAVIGAAEQVGCVLSRNGAKDVAAVGKVGRRNFAYQRADIVYVAVVEAAHPFEKAAHIAKRFREMIGREHVRTHHDVCPR